MGGTPRWCSLDQKQGWGVATMKQSIGVKWALLGLFLVTLLLLVKSNSLLAQVNASITGRVVDSSGAAIPQAAVTVQSMETGETRAVTADDSGSYRCCSCL